MRRYEKMKDSGVKWIGKIPKHWGLKKFKYLAKYVNNNIKTKEFEDTTLIHYSIPNVQEYGTGIEEEGKDINSSKLILKPGLLLISKLNPRKATVTIVDNHEQDLIIGSGEFIPLEIKDKSRFRYYQTCNNRFADYLNSQVESATRSHQRVKPETILSTLAPTPPLSEQTQIVSFLDEKTEKIDALIEKKQRKIELLREKRKALINRVVTKGLNPDAPMKDSDVEWIGEIPEGWNIISLKHFAHIELGKMLTKTPKEGYNLKPYLRSKNIQIEKVDVSEVKEMWFSDDELQNLRVEENDILVSEGGDIGRSCLWRNELEEVYIQNSVHKVSISKGNPFYYHYHFQRHHFIGYFESIVNKVSIPHLTKDKIVNVDFIVPPEYEQKEIVKYLDNQTTEIDQLIDKEQQKIDLLKEYRQSLITEVVTGKIDVRLVCAEASEDEQEVVV